MRSRNSFIHDLLLYQPVINSTNLVMNLEAFSEQGFKRWKQWSSSSSSITSTSHLHPLFFSFSAYPKPCRTNTSLPATATKKFSHPKPEKSDPDPTTLNHGSSAPSTLFGLTSFSQTSATRFSVLQIKLVDRFFPLKIWMHDRSPFDSCVKLLLAGSNGHVMGHVSAGAVSGEKNSVEVGVFVDPIYRTIKPWAQEMKISFLITFSLRLFTIRLLTLYSKS